MRRLLFKRWDVPHDSTQATMYQPIPAPSISALKRRWSAPLRRKDILTKTGISHDTMANSHLDFRPFISIIIIIATAAAAWDLLCGFVAHLTPDGTLCYQGVGMCAAGWWISQKGKKMEKALTQPQMIPTMDRSSSCSGVWCVLGHAECINLVFVNVLGDKCSSSSVVWYVCSTIVWDTVQKATTQRSSKELRILEKCSVLFFVSSKMRCRVEIMRVF